MKLPRDKAGTFSDDADTPVISREVGTTPDAVFVHRLRRYLDFVVAQVGASKVPAAYEKLKNSTIAPTVDSAPRSEIEIVGALADGVTRESGSLRIFSAVVKTLTQGSVDLVKVRQPCYSNGSLAV